MNYLLEIFVVAVTALIMKWVFRDAYRVAPKAASPGDPAPAPRIRWAVAGFCWGLAMYLGMVVTPVVTDAVAGKGINLAMLLWGIPIWAVCGLIFGVLLTTTTSWLQKKPKAA